jgi:thiol-disulfide isomerase/thioredoxin
MTKIKFFSMIVIFSLILLSSNACTKENGGKEQEKVQQNEPQNIEKTVVNNTATKVLNIESVDKVVKGKAIDFTWLENGQKMSFAEYTKGKVVLLNFWATWCPPCRMEIPDIVSIDKEVPKRDLVVIGIALDNRGTVEQVRNLIQNFAKTNKIEYPLFLNTQDLTVPYGGVESIPTTFIIDRKGNIDEKIVGGRSKADFMESIKRALK